MQNDYSHSLSPDMPNVGSVLKGLGYRTAYFGKFEMDKEHLNPEPTVNYSAVFQPYGFDVFGAGGDIGSAPQSGFDNDPFIAGESVRWLREAATQARRSGQPFFMVASFVNAHDIMYGNGNVPGQPPVQIAVSPRALPPQPESSIYERKWSFELPPSLQESLTDPGMPPAVLEYKKGRDGWSGTISTGSSLTCASELSSSASRRSAGKSAPPKRTRPHSAIGWSGVFCSSLITQINNYNECTDLPNVDRWMKAQRRRLSDHSTASHP